jgi:small conductance mechanosensitive channel
MWDWIKANSVWLFIGSSFLLIILLATRQRVRDSIVKAVSEERQKDMGRKITVAFWTIEGMVLVLIAIAGVAMVLSTEGTAAMITTEMLQGWLLTHGIRILIILLMGGVLWYAWKKFLPPMIRRIMVRPVRGESREGMKKRADTIQGVFMGLGKILIILLVSFMLLSELDIAIGPILAGFGIAGIAVGFGAQYLIRDLIAGVFILMENQYRVGDVVRVAGVAGLVEEVNLRKTVLRDLDGTVHHIPNIPNGEIKVASNFTRHFSRVNLNVLVSYGTDLDHAISVINRAGKELAEDENWKWRIKTVPQVLRVDNLGESGIEIKILGDVKPIEQWNVMGELRLRLKKAFDAEGIEIPWSHTKVYFGNPPGNSEPQRH